MIAGPYGTGAKTEAEKGANLRKLNEAAWEVFKKGHVPVVGVNNALPLVAVAGEAKADEIMMPLSLALADKCDACLRIGDASKGADEEVARFKAAGKPVYYSIGAVP